MLNIWKYIQHPNILLISIVAFSIPLVSQLRLYYKLRIKAHLIFSLAFFIGILNRIIYYYGENDEAFYSLEAKLTYYFSYFLLMLIMSEFRSFRLRFFPVISTAILFGSSYLAVFTPLMPREYTGIFEEVFRIIVAGIIFVTVINAEYILDNWKVRTVRLTLLLIGFLLMVLGIFRLYSFVLMIQGKFMFGLGSFLVRDWILAMVATLTSFLALFFPELFLITHSQIASVFKLYNIVPDEIPAEEKKEYIIRYLHTLPKDLLRELGKKGNNHG